MRGLHLLNWNLKDIVGNLDEIKYQGFDFIQITPVQPFKNGDSLAWYEPYQPLGFYIGNLYGSKEDLINLCREASYREIDIVVDVVCNHMAPDETGISVSDKVDPSLRNNRYFWKEFRNVKNWENRWEVTHLCLDGLPGLNLSNYELQDRLISFLNELIDCGVKGFRFDAAKSIALPEEASKYGWNEDSCHFFPRVLNGLKVPKDDLLIYGEIIFERDPSVIESYQQHLMVLTDSFTNNPDQTVMMSESHDSFLGMGYTRDKSSTDIAYDYQSRCKKYPHSLFYARPYDNTWKSEIVRKGNLYNVKSLKK